MRMESDEFDFLAPAYVRGFIRTYARFLDLDPGPLVAEFDRRYAVRAEPAQIAALERRRRDMPKQRRRRSKPVLAAMGVAAVLALLAIVGLLSGPEDDEPPRSTAARATATPSKTPSPSPSPRPSPTPELVLSEGIKFDVTAETARCWIAVESDGERVFTGILEIGDASSFSAERAMEVRLGAPWGVELTVNGRQLPLPETDEAITLRFPRDAAALFGGTYRTHRG